MNRRNVLRDPATAVGLGIVAFALVNALAAPLVAPHDPTLIRLEDRLLSPDETYRLGTDHLGRDELSRLLHGTRMTMGSAGLVLLVVVGVALGVGTIAGYFGGWVDALLMALVDVLLSLPALVLVIAVTGVLGPSLANVMIAMAAVWWAGQARVVRGLVLATRTLQYIEASRALGATDLRIIGGHILRNILGPVVVFATQDFGWIVLGLSGVSFLGLGAQPPTPELGAMLNDGRPYLDSAPQLLLYPGAAICLIVLGFHLTGDGLRDHLDPRRRRPS